MHSLFMFLGYMALAWVLCSFINAWSRQVSVKRKEELNELYAKIDSMVEKRVRDGVSEIKGRIKVLAESGDRSKLE